MSHKPDQLGPFCLLDEEAAFEPQHEKTVKDREFEVKTRDKPDMSSRDPLF